MSHLNSEQQSLDNDYSKQQQQQPKQYGSDCIGSGGGSVGVDASSTDTAVQQHILSYQTAAPAKTILITNNYTAQSGSSNVSGNHNINSTGTNSITILTSPGPHSVVDATSMDPSKTVVLDRINICINNHYDSVGQSAMSIKQEPSGTVKIKQEKSDNEYSIGDDVLVQQKDGKFFFGTVIMVSSGRCLIRFDDNTEKWAEHKELKKFGVKKQVDTGPLCVVCKKQQNNEIVESCERCGRGYHRRCTQGNFGPNGVLHCRRCLSKSEPNDKQVQHQEQFETKINSRILTDKSQLSYNLDSLQWDAPHKVNKQGVYCYCGGPGEWIKQMLQCSRCQQWFHEKCLKSLKYPLFFGDRFYIFVCSMCNFGTEFVRRLELTWPDLVHLVLYNLSTHEPRKPFFDSDLVIVPYVIEFWNILQPSKNMKKFDSEIKENVLKTLREGNCFRNGKEVRKRQTLWSLRKLTPPDAPFLILPDDGKTITESYIKNIWAESKLQLNFVNTDIDLITGTGVTQSVIRNRMKGQHYHKFSTVSDYDSDDSSKFESDDEIPVKFIIEKDTIGKFRDCKTIEKNTSVTSSKCSGDSRDSSDRSQEDNYDDNSRDSSTLPLGVPAKNNVNVKNKIEKRRLRKRKLAPVSDVEKNKKQKLDETPDSSNDDDTSSRSTLDFIIPPPKNFQGTNNPFNQSYTGQKLLEAPTIGGTVGTTAVDKVERKQKNKLGFPGKIRIVRTVRRRLSAKDIIIGPNQQVRRRKNRKITGDVEVISTTITSTGGSSFLPARTDFKDWNRKCHPLQRHSTKLVGDARRSSGSTSGISVPSSPAGDNVEQQSSNAVSVGGITSYFAPNSRIRSGERFRVRGKRVAPNGQTQLLVDWESAANVSLF